MCLQAPFKRAFSLLMFVSATPIAAYFALHQPIDLPGLDLGLLLGHDQHPPHRRQHPRASSFVFANG